MAIENRRSWARAYGLRADNAIYSVGDELPCSRVWVDGIPTEETLNGTSAISIFQKNKRELIKNYGLKYIYLVAGVGSEYGEDEGEEVITRCTVIAILKNLK